MHIIRGSRNEITIINATISRKKTPPIIISNSCRITTPAVMTYIPDAYKSLILKLTDEGIKQEERPTSEDVISLLS
jgi:hypothetical protein